MKLYGINEIYRNGLLLSMKGEPYKTKISVREIVNSLPYKIKLSRWGDMKCLTIEQIDEQNRLTKEKARLLRNYWDSQVEESIQDYETVQTTVQVPDML